MTDILIIDDESRARNILALLLQRNIKDDIVIRSADGAQEGLRMIKEQCPDLLFLDIQMPHMNGFELLESFQSIPFEVIFTTAFDEHAIRAIQFSALDYLLKPIREDLLAIAYDRFLTRKSSLSGLALKYSNLLHNLELGENEIPQIAISSQQETRLVKINTIIRMEADSNYTQIFLDDDIRIISTKTLKSFDSILQAFNFIRTHKSHLVNPAKIVKIIRSQDLIMEDGATVPISRRRRELLKGIKLQH